MNKITNGRFYSINEVYQLDDCVQWFRASFWRLNLFRKTFLSRRRIDSSFFVIRPVIVLMSIQQS